jgi:hypothetical protein
MALNRHATELSNISYKDAYKIQPIISVEYRAEWVTRR